MMRISRLGEDPYSTAQAYRKDDASCEHLTKTEQRVAE
jgi:hypothetical protein